MSVSTTCVQCSQGNHAGHESFTGQPGIIGGSHCPCIGSCKPMEWPFPPPKPAERSASYLSPPDFHRLNWACRPIKEAFGCPPYLVGSVLTRPDYRDIDLRMILDDDVFEAMFGNTAGVTTDRRAPHVLLLMNIAISDLIQRASNPPAPIDFQFQSMTEANVPEHGLRNPMGMPR